MAVNYYDNGSSTFSADYTTNYSMIEKFAKQMIFQVQSTNPLAWIDKGEVRNGVGVEQAITQLLESSEWVSEIQDGSSLNAPSYPTINVQYFYDWTSKQFKTTISEDQIRKALLADMTEMDIASKIVSNLTESEGYEDYEASKGLLTSAVSAGNIVSAGTATIGTGLITSIKNITDEMQYVNNSYLGYVTANTSSDYKTRTPFERLHIIMPYSVYNELNVEVLASLYNLDKARLLDKITLIDTTDGIVYIVDEFGLLKYRRLYKMTSKYVEDALYSNYWLTVSRMYGSSNLFKMAYLTVT